jgi:ribonuclease D
MSLPPIVTDAGALAELAERLRTESVIAVDLEADSLHSYRDKVCLLQISTPTDTVLVDPLPLEDLAALAPVLADAGIRKIFHAADYDIRSLYRDFRLEIRGLFDTMIASQMLGEERVGLADVLNKHLGVSLDKRYQRADWSKRPLEEGMIRYAMEDTCHLHRLADILEARLVAKGRLTWAREEFALLEQVRPAENSGPLFVRVKGAALLDRAQLAVLEQLLQWRDKEACRRDRPPFKVVGNSVLLSLARSGPRTLRAMQGVEGLSPRLLDRYGRQLLEVVEAARALPAEQWPIYPRGERRERDPAAERRLKTLKRWRTGVATELAMDPGILINNAQLEGLARACPADDQQLRSLELLKNWQGQVLADGLLQALRQTD